MRAPMTKETALMRTAHGREVYPWRMTPEMVHVDDIAAHLAKLCRYCGGIGVFYSVAQHSVLVSHLVEVRDPELAFEGLLHDAAEAYCADLPRPVKKFCRDYLELEGILEEAIVKRFNLQYPWHPLIKEMDDLIVGAEKRDLRDYAGNDATSFLLPITPLDHVHSQRLFLERFEQLRRSR